MTLQYDQNNINLQQATPIVVTTPDATPVLITLGTISDDQSLTVAIEGGGSDPAAVTTNNYVVNTGGVATFTRTGGTGVATGGPFVLISAGAVVTLAFAIVDGATTSTCQLSITGPANPYDHNLRAITVQF